MLFYSFTHEIEAVSCDELFADLTNVVKETGVHPEDVAKVSCYHLFLFLRKFGQLIIRA